MSSPRLTIGIPTRQRLALLREAVASALAQEGADCEVLVSQDVFPGGHADPDLAAWCRDLAAREPRVVWRLAEAPLGLAGNWNAVLARAAGEFFTIIGDDDRLAPDFARQLLARADRDGADVAFSDHHIIGADGARDPAETEAQSREYGRADLAAGRVADPEALVWRNAVPMLAAIVRTAAARPVGFHDDLNTPEIVLFLHLARQGGVFAYEPARLAEYRRHPAAATGGGLWSERLAPRLLAIEAKSPAATAARRTLLGGVLQNAVSRLLAAGEVRAARALSCAPEYPTGRAARALALAARLPRPLARAAHAALAALKPAR